MRRGCERYIIDKRIKDNQKKRNTVDENEKSQMAQIDWYDFVIVEAINFTEDELANTIPVEPNDYNANADINSIEGNINSLLNTSVKKEMMPVRPKEITNINSFTPYVDTQIPVATTMPKIDIADNNKPEPGMKIVKNYIRKTETKSNSLTARCPLCFEFIEEGDLINHIKIELLDPKWRELNKELEERKNNSTNTDDMLSNLSEFSKNRPDLFGEVRDVVKEEEVIETNAPGVVWGGFAPNMTRTTANIAMLNAQTRKNIEETRKLRESSIPTLAINPVPTNIPNPNQNIPKQTSVTPQVTLPVIQENKEKTLLSEDAWIKKYPVRIYFNFRIK
jgi:splicing factor 3A subunit 1